MREDLKRYFGGRFLLNIVLSCMVSLAVMAFFLASEQTIGRWMEEIEWMSAVYRMASKGLVVPVLCISCIGILSFVVTFSILNAGQIRIIRQLSEAMGKISKGDLSIRVESNGEDELAVMASNLNTMTEDIERLIRREREAEQSKNELITNVAHDLRTPLTSILGYLALLEQGRVTEEKMKQRYIHIAHQKAIRLQHLIDDLFGFTKLTNGRPAVHYEKVDLVKLIEQVLDEFYPILEDSCMDLDYQKNVASIPMRGDGAMLARLFDNLLNNAIKYGRDGKLIRVHIMYVEPLVQIQVINYGYVIPEQEITLIFQKFYRLERSRSSQTGGTGLGLAIVKTIVELHGGTVEARSSLEGTIFEVKFNSNFDENCEDFRTPE